MTKTYEDMVTLIGRIEYEPFRQSSYHIPDGDITMNRLYSVIDEIKGDRRFNNITLYFRVIDEHSIDVCYDMVDCCCDEHPRVNMCDDILPFIRDEFIDDGRINIKGGVQEQLWRRFK